MRLFAGVVDDAIEHIRGIVRLDCDILTHNLLLNVLASRYADEADLNLRCDIRLPRAGYPALETQLGSWFLYLLTLIWLVANGFSK